MLKCSPDALARCRGNRRAQRRAGFRTRAASRPRSSSARLSGAVLRSVRRSAGHEQGAGRRPRHPRSAAPTTCTTASRWRDLEGFEERYGLNSRLVKRNGRLVEEVCRVGGRYGGQIAGIVHHLQAALPLAPPATRQALEALIRFYETGEDAGPRDLRHRVGRGQGLARSTRSTASSRTTSTRAASRARGKRSCST